MSRYGLPPDWGSREVGDNPYQPPNAPTRRRTAPVSPSTPQDGQMVTEAAFQAKVIAHALRQGWLFYHTHDSRRSPGGFPDLVLVRPPEIIFAELKRDDGKLTKAQSTWLGALWNCPSVQTCVWRPSDWDAIERTLAP